MEQKLYIKIIGFLAITCAIACFSLSSKAQVVAPLPDAAGNVNAGMSVALSYSADSEVLHTPQDELLLPNPDNDRDKDGVPDSIDLCPYEIGSKKANGCPDMDNDSVPDFEDLCPTVPGLVKYQGCPDTDGDGIPDNIDVCPNEPGPASNKGCPESVEIAFDDQEDEDTVVVITTPARTDFYDDETRKALLNQDYQTMLERQRIEEEWLSNEKALAERATKVKQGMNPKTDSMLRTHTLNTDSAILTNVEENPLLATGLDLNKEHPLNNSTGSKVVRVLKRDIILSNDEMRFLENVFTNLSFSSGRIALDNNSYVLLDQFSDLMNKKYSWVVILHCYTNEGSNISRSQKLSANRGELIRTYLVKKGIAANRIHVKAYSDTIVNPNSASSHIELDITR